jgi:type IV pilus assembly protein PilA
MNIEYQKLYLRYLLQRDSNQGFTIFHLLLMILIVVILGAMTLPSLMSCGNKARSAEAKQYIGSMNRAQQAYFSEKNKFASKIKDLDVGMKNQTTNYNYSIAGATSKSVFNYAIARSEYIPQGLFDQKKRFKSYVGVVFTSLPQLKASPEVATGATTCETENPATIPTINPTYVNNTFTCVKGTKLVKYF